jgi:SAM-dependent methyltransferase
LKAISEEYSNVNLVGLEHNEAAVKKMNREGIFAVNQYIEQHALVKPSEYDFIFAFQVLEHVPNVKTFLDACLKALKPGGILFFGVPNNDSFIFRNDLYHVLNLPPHHMGLWGNKSLRNLANIFNLKILAIAEQPADKNNLGIYFKVWLKKYLPRYQDLLYPLFRIPVKIFLRVFTPKRGHTITVSYQKPC